MFASAFAFGSIRVEEQPFPNGNNDNVGSPFNFELAQHSPSTCSELHSASETDELLEFLLAREEAKGNIFWESPPDHSMVSENQGAASGDSGSKELTPSSNPPIEIDSLPLCAICGEKALKFSSYGARACISCRVFFRRMIQKSQQSGLNCRKKQGQLGHCVIDSKSRGSCRRCRYERCLQAGDFSF